MSQLIIADNTIRQDAEGRYCLNDLHKAAGGESKHRPSFFMRRPESADLIEALKCAEQHISPTETERGRYGGTYVCKELVYSYAMWISATFQLKVIRAYDAMHTPAPAKALSPAQTLLQQAQMLVDLEQKQAEQEQKQAEQEKRQAEQEKRQSEQEAAITAIQTVVERNGAPEGFLPLSQLRNAIKTYGLSDRVLKWVLEHHHTEKKRYSYHTPSGDPQFGTAWRVHDAELMLKHFASKVERVTEQRYTHPDYPGRFQFQQ